MSAYGRLSTQLVSALRLHLAKGLPPQIPEAGIILWKIFCELNATRTHSMAGPNPISFSEIDAWARLHGFQFQPQHIIILCEMDRVWLAHAFKNESSESATASNSRSAQAISPAIFDAVFK